MDLTAAHELYFMAKAFGKLPSEIIDPVGLMSPLERFELDRDVWTEGLTEEDRIQKKAIADWERKNKGKN